MKKNKRTILIIFFVMSILLSCKTQKTACFEIGSGGGFTGKYIEYKVCSNGKIYDISNGQKETLFATFDKNKIKNIFSEFDKLNLDQLIFSAPGNMNYYIRITTENGTHEIKWGDFKKSPPQNILNFYNKVWNEIRPK